MLHSLCELTLEAPHPLF